MTSPTSAGLTLLNSIAYLLGQQTSNVSTKQKATVKYCSATCPDPQCRTKLYFPSHEASVECTSCGQRHSVKDLPDKQELKGNQDKFGVELAQLKQLSASGKKTSDLVKVKGISNYHCKLLSPLLTTFGMDKSDQAKPLKELGMGETFDCSKLANRAFAIEEGQLNTMGYGRDRSGSAKYLSDTLEQLKLVNGNRECLVPVHADGDGHCLVHAISRCLVGRELFWHALRTNLYNHLTTNLDKYKEMFKDFYADEDWPDFIKEAAPEFQPTDGQEFGLRNIHIFGLANVLRRPIILLDSLLGMQSSGDYSGTFLPALHTPEECRSKDASGTMKLNSPIMIAWSTNGHNHFIPLVPIKGQPLPKLPPDLRPKVWGIAEEKLQEYVATDAKGCIEICSGKELADKYIQKLVACMEKVFLDKNGVVPSLVADVNQYVYKSVGCVGVSPETVISATRSAVEETRLFRCLFCRAISCVPPDWLKSGGDLYNKAAEKFDLEDGTPYSFPMDGVSAIYDSGTDSLKAFMVNCFWCAHTSRPVNANDTMKYENMDRTTTISKGSRCGCGFMHYWDGKEYDNLPEKIPLALTWAGRTVQITVYWFQHESDPERNSNVYEVAQKAVTDNFPGEFGSERLVQQVVDQILAATARKENMEQVTHSTPQGTMSGTQATPTTTPTVQQQDSSHVDVPASKFIITGQKTKTLHKEELTMSETERKIARQVEEKARLQQQKRKTTPATTQERKREAPGSRSPVRGVSPPPPSSRPPATPPSPPPGKPAHKKIRVTSSEGKTANLTLEPSVTFSELQAAIERELSIPAERQRLRSGFPPRELRPSSDPSLPVNLSNGERVSVDVVGQHVPSSEERSPLKSAPPTSLLKPAAFQTDKESSQKDAQQTLNTILQQMLGGEVDLWAIAQHQPQLFRKGGDYYQQVLSQYGDQLKDHTHFQFKEFSNKVFAYNAAKECLEICLGSQHVPVGVLTPEQEQRAQAIYVLRTTNSEGEQLSDSMMDTAVGGMGMSGAISKPGGASSVKAFSGKGHTLMDASLPPQPSDSAGNQDPLLQAAQMVVQKRLVTLQSRERELHTQVRSINRQMVQADANQDGASVQDDVLSSLETKLLDVSSELKKVREEIRELTTL